MIKPLVASVTMAFLLPSIAVAQQILLLPIVDGDEFHFGEPIVVNQTKGYNNQPAFTSDSSALLFSSDLGGNQMDIIQFKISTQKRTNLTNTPSENEFSPQSGDDDGEIIYVLEQGVPDQSVWSQTNGQPRQRAINSFIDSGYYARIKDVGTLLWARYGHHLYFEPPNEQADENHFVAGSIGRSIHPIPNQNAFSFVHKQINDTWVIKRFEPASGNISPLINIDKNSEDYTWFDENRIWKGDGSSLLQWQHGEQRWQSIADLTNLGVTKIGRLDVSPNGKWLAVVELSDK